MNSKKSSYSLNIHTELIMPGHTNPLGNLMGGNLLSWMDVASGISALRHSGQISVTVGVDNVTFRLPIKVGDVVIIKSFVTRAFKTSMEVICEVYLLNIETNKEVLSHQAFFTFVALNKAGERIDVPPVEPESDIEKMLFESALNRREVRLLLAGKIRPDDAPNLKSIFGFPG